MAKVVPYRSVGESSNPAGERISAIYAAAACVWEVARHLLVEAALVLPHGRQVKQHRRLVRVHLRAARPGSS
jgi:hypothetical protein